MEFLCKNKKTKETDRDILGKRQNSFFAKACRKVVQYHFELKGHTTLNTHVLDSLIQ